MLYYTITYYYYLFLSISIPSILCMLSAYIVLIDIFVTFIIVLLYELIPNICFR